MDETPLPEMTEQFARTLAPDPDETIAAMDDRADREGFPTVGPAVGAWLRLLARLTDAERVFEFGSGFGYSAYWMAPAVGEEIVLTEVDANELQSARDYFEQGGYADRATFEHGDAIDIVGRYDGPFDVVLVDNEKRRYTEAFEAVREKVPVGGVVAADNAIKAEVLDFSDIRALLAGEPVESVEASDASRGIAGYLNHVRTDPDFETSLLPLGEGVAASVRVE